MIVVIKDKVRMIGKTNVLYAETGVTCKAIYEALKKKHGNEMAEMLFEKMVEAVLE